MSNFPHEEVFVINGHACISLDKKISAMMFHGVPIDWMQDADGNINDQVGINATPAARWLLNGMRARSNNRPNTAYGWMTKWSDGFLRSFVCQVGMFLVFISFVCLSIRWPTVFIDSLTSSQKGNSVWILTNLFGNPDGNPTSIFHTSILAVGRACYDHTPVIDYFLKEIKAI